MKTDHNPLVGLFKKDIRDSSEKLQSMLEVCSRYTFQTEYIPGKKNLVADLLSRNPLWKDATIIDKCGRIIAFTDSWRTVKDDPRMSEILEAAGANDTYKEAVQAKLDGMTAEEVKRLVGAERPFGKVNTKIDKLRKFSILIFKSSTQFSFHSDRASLPNVPG